MHGNNFGISIRQRTKQYSKGEQLSPSAFAISRIPTCQKVSLWTKTERFSGFSFCQVCDFGANLVQVYFGMGFGASETAQIHGNFNRRYDVKAISEYLGHCNTEITSNIYVHIFKEYKAKMAESIEHDLL